MLFRSDIKEADKYFDEHGIMPYTSEGQIDVPLDLDGTKYSIKKPYDQKKLSKDETLKNDPLTGLPLNANGTVTLYYPTTNEGAKELARTKRLKGSNPEANRIYLTNEKRDAVFGDVVGPRGMLRCRLECDAGAGMPPT